MAIMTVDPSSGGDLKVNESNNFLAFISAMSKRGADDRASSKSPKKARIVPPLVEEQPKEITVDEAALYDRQIRLWGLKAQQR
jgi:hypothetical protein